MTESGVDLTAKFESSGMVPGILQASMQVASPSAPSYAYTDLPEKGLLCSDELDDIAGLSSNIESAQEHISFLYSYRAFYQALARSEKFAEYFNQKAEGDDSVPAHVKVQYRKLFEPRLKKLSEVYEFVNKAIDNIAMISQQHKYDPSEILFDKLLECFDILFNIDTIKISKSGITTDFSRFKNAKKKDQTESRPEDSIENDMQFQFYLGQRNYNLSRLKEKLRSEGSKPGPKLQNSYDFFCKFLDYIIVQYNSPPMVPHKLSKIITSITTILSTHGFENIKGSPNIFEYQGIRDIYQIIADNPIGIIVGDQTFLPGEIVMKAEGHIQIKGVELVIDRNQLEERSSNFLVKHRIAEFRSKYQDDFWILCELKNKEVVDPQTFLSILNDVSSMALGILFESKYKLIVPATAPKDASNVLQYDLFVRYNYDKEDLDCLTELIGYIKTLYSILMENEQFITETITKHMNDFIQNFVLNELERPLCHAKNGKDDEEARHIEMLRILFGIWRSNTLPNVGTDPKKLKPHPIPKTNVIFAQYHLDVLRQQLSQMMKPDSKFVSSKRGLRSTACFHAKHINITKEFLNTVRCFPYFQNYFVELRDACNLGMLWFREMSLDLDKILLYPVQSSLPFILADHLLEHKEKTELHDSFLYPFELYNDAAYTALHTYNSQYLYHEIEAEVNLCFNMVAFLFSDAYYKFTLKQAASVELPADCTRKIITHPNRYSVIAQQNKVDILGTSYDFCQIVTNKINQNIQADLESTLNLLTDMRSLPYVMHMLDVLSTCHFLLCESGLRLDPFDDILKKVKGTTSIIIANSLLSSKLSRIVDLKTCTFNTVTRRFVYPKGIEFQPLSNEDWCKDYATLHNSDGLFFGEPHFYALVHCLNGAELAIFTNKLINSVKSVFINFIKLYAEVAPAVRLLPAISKDNLTGFFTFNCDAYGSLTHPDLKKMFTVMRNFGNIIAFVSILEDYINPSIQNVSILSSIMESIKSIIKENEELFFSNNTLDIETTITHRMFTSLWCVLEFFFCSPKANSSIADRSNGPPKVPIEIFGDGPIIGAHVLITLCNQVELYKFDSMCYRATEMMKTETIQGGNENLNIFSQHASVVLEARKFANNIAAPYAFQRE